ncbi:hypothetical protein GWK47_018887 [Chionoecetes opilio]|uniref:Uncharacterized protein n=1 Tax=Chionoecetes opilio TaxID=41210 RepID=A0A8J5CLJ6_CHIOP|nr:hypothetical protein GWK47_018887 [Chionoecetes opilio]
MDLLPPPRYIMKKKAVVRLDEENVQDDGFLDISSDDTSDDRWQRPLVTSVETSDSLTQQLQLPIFSMVPETPLLWTSGTATCPRCPPLLWNSLKPDIGRGSTGCVRDYARVVALREDTVPFLGWPVLAP